MDTYVEVPFSRPATYRLADIKGVLLDLASLVLLCNKLLRYKARSPRPDSTEMEALESAALVRYGRCFKRGVRTAFLLGPDWVSKLPQELQEAHSDFEALRDKHVAHSVNDWELNIPIVYLRQNRATGTNEISSVAVKSHRILEMDTGSIDQLKKLAEALTFLIEPEFEAEKERVLQLARQIPIAELEARLGTPPARAGVRGLDKPRGR